jgi:hypothetical protein
MLRGPMNSRHSFAVCGLVFLATVAQGFCSEPRLLFETHLNARKPQLADSVAGMALDARGNVFLAGSTDKNGGTAALLERHDATGARKWTSLNSVAGKPFTRGNALALDSRGRPILVSTGTDAAGAGGTLAITKSSASGALLYSAPIEQPADTSAEGVAVAVDGSDSFYVLANHLPAGAPVTGVETAYLRKYNAAGQPEWALPLICPGALGTRAFAMKLDGEGHAVITGQAVLPSTGAPTSMETAYATFKVSPAGTTEWSDVYARVTRGDNHAAALAMDAAGNVYVTGVSSSPHSDTLTAVTTVRYDSATGARRWVSHFDATEQDSGYLGLRSFAGSAIVVDADNVWVAAQQYLAIRLSPADGGFSNYTHLLADSETTATIERIVLLEPTRGLLLAGSISDAEGTNDFYVQLVDAAFNYGWKLRFHPSGSSGGAMVGFARGLNQRLYLAANSVPSSGTPASDGALFGVAPPAVPTVQVYPLLPLAIEPVGSFRGLAGRFRIHLSMPAEQDLGIWFGLEGSAHWDVDEGLDYNYSDSPVVVISKGQRYADVVIRPVADDLKEGFEDVTLTLHPGGLPTLNDYIIGKRSTARVLILDTTR